MTAAAGRRLLAEFTGTGLLVTVVVGSGIAATRLTADGALRLLVDSVVTALGLAVLIVVFIPASGAHFNPVVTAADWLLGRRTPRRYSLAKPPPDHNPPTSSTPPSSRPWPRSGSTSPTSSPSR